MACNEFSESGSVNTSHQHIPLQQLADYLEGRLLPGEQAQLEAHIGQCAQCANELAYLQRITGFLQTPEDAPPSVIQQAVNLFQRKDEPEPLLSGLRRRVLAALKFDSVGLTPAFGVRSGKPGSRQLLFSTNVDEIDLRIEPEGQAWLISGQVLGETQGQGMAILEGASGMSETTLNELSEFTLPPVQAGTYKLTLSLADVDVEIEEIKVGG
jgi:anti-sigma factor RsiW